MSHAWDEAPNSDLLVDLTYNICGSPFVSLHDIYDLSKQALSSLLLASILHSLCGASLASRRLGSTVPRSTKRQSIKMSSILFYFISYLLAYTRERLNI
jgi:hypothetical protein